MMSSARWPPFHVLFFASRRWSLSNFIEQRVSLTIEHPVALLDGGQTDGLGQVALTCAGWTQEQSIFMFGDKVGCGQIEDQRAIEFFVEGEVEVVQGFLRVAELGLFLAAFEQAVGSAGEFI